MPGPVPRHPSVRRRRNDATKGFRLLRAEGGGGAVPPWPLQPDLSLVAELEAQRDRVAALQAELPEIDDRRRRGRLQRETNRRELAIAVLELEIEQSRDAEVALWNDLWAMPQAVLWRETNAQREVAQYVRWKIRAESGNLRAGVEARQLSDRLGLNPLALLRLRAEVERVGEAERQGTQRRAAKKAPANKAAANKKPVDPRSFLSVVKGETSNGKRDRGA